MPGYGGRIVSIQDPEQFRTSKPSKNQKSVAVWQGKKTKSVVAARAFQNPVLRTSIPAAMKQLVV
jgi:hypothetical protein